MKNIFIVILMTVMLSSCITTLHPLVSTEAAIIEDGIEGTWNNDEQEEFKVLRFFKNYDAYMATVGKYYAFKGDSASKEERIKDSIRYSKGYIIEFTKKGIKHLLYGSLIRLNGNLFINMTPVFAASITDSSKMIDPIASLSTNTIARIQLSASNKIQLDFIDGGFLYDQIKAGRMKIKHESDDLYDSFLITASTTELQQFLVKYGNDNRFFNKENSVILTRKS